MPRPRRSSLRLDRSSREARCPPRCSSRRRVDSPHPSMSRAWTSTPTGVPWRGGARLADRPSLPRTCPSAGRGAVGPPRRGMAAHPRRPASRAGHPHARVQRRPAAATGGHAPGLDRGAVGPPRRGMAAHPRRPASRAGHPHARVQRRPAAATGGHAPGLDRGAVGPPRRGMAAHPRRPARRASRAPARTTDRLARDALGLSGEHTGSPRQPPRPTPLMSRPPSPAHGASGGCEASAWDAGFRSG